MMDERLIGEVQKHAIIYNRQKSNMINGDKSASKELAWANIALNLGTDADSCKKRWKYLRERYVQQKKVGDSPSYEHLSRPYLEKMKFLDHFIQPRKSYRNVSHLLSSPNSSQHGLIDADDEYKSDRSIKMSLLNNFHENGNTVGINGAEDAYQQYYRLHATRQEELKKPDDHRHIPHPAPDLIKNEAHLNMASSSSSVISSQASPAGPSSHNEMLTETDGQKRRRTSILEQSMNHQNLSDNEEQSSTNDIAETETQRSPPFPSDFLYPFYQHAQRQVRNSEQLLGELVTSELLKMSKDRKKVAQKKILEILFFDD